ncbi:MAG: hypothetical protein PVI92_10410 [Chromatiales bacterium]|jgi:hypothetical protein
MRPQGKLLLATLLALIAGITLYLFTRPPQTAYFMQAVPFLIVTDKPLYCPLCETLPSLLHAFAFILLSAIALEPKNRQQLIAICLTWSGIEAAFELGQIDRIAIWIQNVLPAWFQEIPLLSITGDFFLLGTFDPLDLLSIGLGTLAAYRLLMSTIASEADYEHSNDRNQLPH